MPILTPSYAAFYVNRTESFPAIAYSTATKAWSVTPNGAFRVSIQTGDADEQALLINGSYVMFVLNDGTVQVGDFTKNPLASGSVPRLDFVRKAGGQGVRFASLNQDGVLNAWDIFEGTVPTGTDRMYLLGNPNCSIGPDGLLTTAVQEISLLVTQDWNSGQPGPFMSDQFGKRLQDQSGRPVVPQTWEPSDYTVAPGPYIVDQSGKLLVRLP